MKWVLLNGTNVENVIIPGDADFKVYLEGQGKTVHIVEDDIPVAPYWAYDSEEQSYYDPQS
jgi:hypothetical protein